MEPRNLAWCRRILAGIVNFNEGQTDQDFNTTNDAYYHFDDALTEAYDFEVNEAKVAVSSEPFKRTLQLTWDGDDVTFVLPEYMTPEDILEVYDVTTQTTGVRLGIGRRSQGATLYWKEDRILQWGEDGPGDDKTLEFTFVASAQALKKPLQEPTLITNAHRHLLPWSAACVLADKAEQVVPSKWEERRDELRLSWYTALSRGRPAHQNPPRMRNHRRRNYGR